MSRQQYSGSKKFQIALEAIKGKETIAALSTKHGIAPTLISKWKQDLLERGCELFEKGHESSITTRRRCSAQNCKEEKN
ncbi:helix-turn-helix domain-containing protein [Piscirickettsia salmonis]|nr:helix-turn-helix domain-containing protein [Piscirickettsia salmonis]APS84903.1 hypothetical protein AVM71_17645 [Piscirickettsia salmonis]QGO71727.1 hypothetical protein Psal081_03240 [Piscirickettsia salmonis]QGO92603.1 hypothetical protein Psal110_03236 [Piscirickettsia salmonis]